MALANVGSSAQDAYLVALYPYARISASMTGIPAELIVSFWSWETHFGTNQTAKVNNHGGIKANSSGADYVSGQYAGYTSVDSFARDWGRVLNLSYYDGVRAAARNQGYHGIVKAFNASPYAESDYNISTIIDRAKRVVVLTGGQPAQNVDEMDTDDLKRYAGIGIAAVGLFALVSGLSSSK